MGQAKTFRIKEQQGSEPTGQPLASCHGELPVGTSGEAAAGRAKVIAIASGKGGVGKTNVVVNLAVALSLRGKRIVVFDADFSLANIDVLLGLNPKFHLGDMLEGRKSLGEIIMEGPAGIKIVPAASGVQQLAALTVQQRARVFESLSLLRQQSDFLLIDMAAGISDNVVRLLDSAEEIVVVCAPEPTAIVDAYALVKVINRDDKSKPIKVLVNLVESCREADRVFSQLNMVAKRFLRRELYLLGHVYRDDAVASSVRRQTAVVTAFPSSRASRCFISIAQQLLNEAAQSDPTKAPIPWQLQQVQGSVS